ncbi:hypothetical protein WAI453_007830 [Rhynchosporium graminicola]
MPSANIKVGQMLEVVLRHAAPGIIQEVPLARVAKTFSMSKPGASAKPRGRPRKEGIAARSAAVADTSNKGSQTRKRERQHSTAPDQPMLTMSKKPKNAACSASPAEQILVLPAQSPCRSKSFRVPSPMSPFSSQLSMRDISPLLSNSVAQSRTVRKEQPVVIDLLSDSE